MVEGCGKVFPEEGRVPHEEWFWYNERTDYLTESYGIARPTSSVCGSAAAADSTWYILCRHCIKRLGLIW